MKGPFPTRLLFAPLPAIIRMRRSLGSDQSRSPMARKRTPPFNPQTFLSKVGRGKTSLPSPNKHDLFARGCGGCRVLYPGGQGQADRGLAAGQRSRRRDSGAGGFFGESCLAGQTVRTATATALEDSSLVRIDKDAMIQVLHEKPDVRRAVYGLSAGAHDSYPRGFGGSTL